VQEYTLFAPLLKAAKGKKVDPNRLKGAITSTLDKSDTMNAPDARMMISELAPIKIGWLPLSDKDARPSKDA
jgi:hypothetical protein